ncbi:MAG: hypothetical protein V7L09_01535 [Nostoc sp.]|uniref:hypothetical protein n=1 Tax=Nostoc sp. TaxID=1180 RepID=UPI002FEF8FA1
MTMFILAICAGMCQINIYWGLGKQGSSTSLREAAPTTTLSDRGEVAVSLSPLPLSLPLVSNPQS